MNKFKQRVYGVEDFSNKDYATLLKSKTEKKIKSHQSLQPLVVILYIVTIILLAVPFFIQLPDWINTIIYFVYPITYIGAFALQLVIAYSIMITILGAAFSAGLDKDNPPFDMIVGALYCVLAVFVFIACPPVAVANQIKKEDLIIKATDKVLSESN